MANMKYIKHFHWKIQGRVHLPVEGKVIAQWSLEK